jgi:hypothetical protein
MRAWFGDRAGCQHSPLKRQTVRIFDLVFLTQDWPSFWTRRGTPHCPPLLRTSDRSERGIINFGACPLYRLYLTEQSIKNNSRGGLPLPPSFFRTPQGDYHPARLWRIKSSRVGVRRNNPPSKRSGEPKDLFKQVSNDHLEPQHLRRGRGFGRSGKRTATDEADDV